MLLLVLSLLCAAPLAALQELPEHLAAVFEDGVRALKAGRLAEAETAFRRVLREGGEAPYAHNNLGIVYQQRGEHAKAIVEFRAALRLSSGYAAPRVALGASLLALGRVREATTELERAAKLLPREPLARAQLAAAYERAENWSGAVEQYQQLGELEPDDPEHSYRLGKAYLGLSEWCLRQLRQLHPRSARLYQALAHSYRVQGRSDLAVSAFERAALADPTLPEVHLALAQIFLEQERWEDARREIERELALVPESAGALALKRTLDARDSR